MLAPGTNAMEKVNPSIFHTYDVRGIYPTEISEESVSRVGWAFAKYLKTDLKKELPFSVVVGLDMRVSSPFLTRALIRALNDQGIDVVEIGEVSTPAFYYAVAFKDFAAGVMVTASHNPKEYNGLKFCGPQASPIGEGSGLEKIKAYTLSSEESKPMGKGKMSSGQDVTKAYVAQDLSYLNAGDIKKLKIAADPANCMGATYLEELFKQIPSDPIKINWELNGNMPIHEANPLKLETLQQLQAVMKNERADFGIATDGDGDRIVFLDEQAQVIPPSIVIGLIAQELLKKYPKARIGYDLRSSKIVEEMIGQAGGEPVETMVGHSLIKALMIKKDILFAGELSSHYYFRENFNFESPIFVIAQLLLLRCQMNKPMSEIWKPHQKYAQSGEINFEVNDKQGMMDKLAKKYADGKVSKLDGIKVEFKDWWFNVRPSNTEPFLRLNLEADTEELMKQKVEEVSKLIKIS